MLCWRASAVSRSATTAFTRGLEAPWSLTSASVWPTANISLTTPKGPLGLAATTSSPAVNGARRITFHSSVVKLVFASMLLPPRVIERVGRSILLTSGDDRSAAHASGTLAASEWDGETVEGREGQSARYCWRIEALSRNSREVPS